MNTTLISERIKEVRREHGLTQSQFGKLLGVSQDTVSLWELGKALPSVQDVIKIVQTCSTENDRLSADYLLGLTEY